MLDYKINNGALPFDDGESYYQMESYQYSETLLRKDSTGQVTTNTSLQKEHGHSHSNKPKVDRGRRPLIIATALCGVFFHCRAGRRFVLWLVGNLTDAAHLLTDMSSFIISLVAIHLSERPANRVLTYGWHRAEVLGALISIEAIWIMTAILVYSAVGRIKTLDFEIQSHTMVSLSCCAILVNITMGYVLWDSGHGHTHGGLSDGGSHSHGHSHGGDDHGHSHSGNEGVPLNVRAALIHVIGDLLQSIGVLIASVIIYINPEYKIMDPICTLLFSVITLCTTITVAKDLIRFIMEGSPASLDIDHIKTQINVPGVVRIHDLHVWGLTPQQWVLTAHVVIDTSSYNVEEVLREAINALKNDSRFLSITIQPENYDEKTPVMQPCHYMELPKYSDVADLPVPAPRKRISVTSNQTAVPL